jgi:hypothetical protein
MSVENTFVLMVEQRDGVLLRTENNTCTCTVVYQGCAVTVLVLRIHTYIGRVGGPDSPLPDSSKELSKNLAWTNFHFFAKGMHTPYYC